MVDMPGKRVPKVLGFAEGLPADTTPPEFLADFVAIKNVDPTVDDIYSDTASHQINQVGQTIDT
jgi:hypothetical protein